MKTISTALKAHMAQQVTTLASCWRVARTDGVLLYFTDHDQDITFNGHVYLAATGYSRSAIVSDVSLSVDNLEVFGILKTDQIDEHELRNGVYNYASVFIFIVNWANLSMGSMALRRGWFGEVTVTPNGYFRSEMRGLTQALVTNFGQTISAKCRADLGDAQCKVPLDPPLWQANHVYAANTFIKAIQNSTGGAVDPYDGVIWYVSVAGTSGATIPDFTDPTVDVTDHTVTWVSGNAFTQQGYVLSPSTRKVFTVAGVPQPQTTLFGPDANALNQTANITGVVITGIPGGTGHTVTCVLNTNDNNIFCNHLASGVLGVVTSLTTNGGKTITLTGTMEDLNFVLATLTWVNNATKTDLLTIAANDGSFGHSFAQTIPLPQTGTGYSGGTLLWVTGQNAGRAMEIKTFDFTTSTVTLWLSAPFAPQANDVFRVYPGCVKDRPACLTFGNMQNYRAEPDLPGQDFVLAPNTAF